MAVMTIRNIDDAIKNRLRLRAAMHGRSMEDEARDILRSALSTEIPRPRWLNKETRQRRRGYTEQLVANPEQCLADLVKVRIRQAGPEVRARRWPRAHEAWILGRVEA